MALEKHELEERLTLLTKDIDAALEKIQLPVLHAKISALETEMSANGFWDDQRVAQEKVAQLKSAKQVYDVWHVIEENIRDLTSLFEETHEDDYAILDEQLDAVAKQYEEASFVLYFNGEYDADPVLLTIKAGAGGDDAEDFAGMLFRMYTMYCDQHEFTYTLQEYNSGAGSDGIKKATLEIRGPFAYGVLKGEKGVHRLVRLSPFKSSDSRQTSFVHVDVMPLMENIDASSIVIKDEDLRVDTFRASGPGGQYVNKTDSAIRLTHLPANTVVSVQSERSQHQNRERAMEMLRAKLFQLEQQEREAERKELQGENVSVDFGKQIRSYVLHPYKLVKDHRTGVEVTQVEHVLDGFLDPFIEAEVRMFAQKHS